MRVIVQETKYNVLVQETVEEVVVQRNVYNAVISNERGLQGASGAAIDDNNISTGTAYSSQKIENRLDETVGDETTNLSLFFRNQLSQGV